MLMTGPFAISAEGGNRGFGLNQDRERLSVMGVVLEKVDKFNGLVTVVVVD